MTSSKKNHNIPLNQNKSSKNVLKKNKSLKTKFQINSNFLVFILPTLLYLQTLGFGFTNFDDNVIIQNNSSFLNDFKNLPEAFFTDAFLNGSSEFYRPLQTLSYMICMQLSDGKSASTFHFINILLLGFISLVLFILLQKLSIPKKLALFGTILYGVHPLFVSNVAWIPALGDLFLTLFTLLSLLFLIKYLEQNAKLFMILHWISFTLALFSKETAVILPFLFIVYYLCFVQKPKFEKKLIILTILYLISGIIWLWFRSKAIMTNFNSSNEFGLFPSFSESIIHKLRIIPESIFSFIFPFNIFETPNFTIFKTALGSFIIVIFIFIFFKNKNSLLKEKLFGIIWFTSLLIPALIFNKDVYYDYLNHRLLLPLIGILIFLSYLFPKKWINDTKMKFSWIIILVIILFSTFTYINTRSYNSPFNFYNSAIKHNNHSSLAYNNRGFLYGEKGEFTLAIDDFSKAIELNPNYFEAYFNRGLIYSNLNENEKAIKDYSKAIDINKRYYEAYYNRGYIYGNQGKLDEAIDDFTKAISIKPDYSQAINNRGITYLRKGDLNMSCNDFNRAATLGSESAKNNLKKYCNKNN